MFWGSLSNAEKEKYRQKAKRMTVEDLRDEETENIQSKIGCRCEVGSSLIWSVPTLGWSLISGASAGREKTAIKDKLEIIQNELRARGHQPRDSMKREYIKPIAANLIYS